MIDVIEHIENKQSVAKCLNYLGDNIIYNIPIEKNLFDYLKNLTQSFKYYEKQKKRWGHVHFFSINSAQSFLKKHHKVIESYFQPYCFHYRDSNFETYLKLRKKFFWNIEINLSCWIHLKISKISKYIIQGSSYSFVKTKTLK